MSGFEKVTGLEPIGDGAYGAEVDAGWTIAGKPNGGYLLVLLGRAAVARIGEDRDDHPHVLAASAQYLAAPDPGTALVHVQVLRTGRTATQARVQLLQGDQVCVEALLLVGRLDAAAEPWWNGEPPVALPPEEACARVPVRDPHGREIALYDRIEVRLDPANLGFATGNPGGTGELRGWMRFGDGYEPDPLGLLFAVDAFPPATLDLGSRGWVPTLELTAYVRAIPAPGPLRVRQRARLIQAGFVDELCEVWDAAGRLVAHGSQLARVRMPGDRQS